MPEKVRAITDTPAPSNVSELRSYLGMLQYARFLPNLSSELSPLHDLLKDKTPWLWTDKCQAAFLRTKQLLTSARVLTHYDVNLPIRLECEASSAGLGTVISHEMLDGMHQPVMYTSRTLSKSERNYAQIEKEALALVFGVKKFHDFLYALHTRDRPQATHHQYQLQFRSTEEHKNTDKLSRLPLKEENFTASEEPVFSITCADSLPVTSRQIAEATRKDPVMSKVLSHTLNGWPAQNSDRDMQPYFNRRTELSVEGGVLLWGLRVVVPPAFRDRLLEELHDKHPGIYRMKALARSYVWWPNIDTDIEGKVKTCHDCTRVCNTPPTAPLQPWSWLT